MKTFIAAFLIVAGFTLWSTGDGSILFTVALLIAKLALIIGGGCLIADDFDQEGEV